MGYLKNPDNIIAALEQSNRVCRVRLDLADWQSEEVLAPMRAPFPELTYLTSFHFQGATEYLEDLVTLIDAP